VFSGKVGGSFVGKTDYAKLLALGHLNFVTIGW